MGSDQKTPLERDMQTYLSLVEGLGDQAVQTDPLEFWARHGDDLKILSRIARVVLSLQVTSSSVERLFSNANLVFSPLRSRLNDENLNMLSVVSSWLKAKNQIADGRQKSRHSQMKRVTTSLLRKVLDSKSAQQTETTIAAAAQDVDALATAGAGSERGEVLIGASLPGLDAEKRYLIDDETQTLLAARDQYYSAMQVLDPDLEEEEEGCDGDAGSAKRLTRRKKEPSWMNQFHMEDYYKMRGSKKPSTTATTAVAAAAKKHPPTTPAPPTPPKKVKRSDEDEEDDDADKDDGDGGDD